jgi:hypothetical protein
MPNPKELTIPYDVAEIGLDPAEFLVRQVFRRPDDDPTYGPSSAPAQTGSRLTNPRALAQTSPPSVVLAPRRAIEERNFFSTDELMYVPL